MSFSIIGTGSAYPEKIITNENLAQVVDTSDEWIASRTGIRQRFVQTGESLSDYSLCAAKLALENARTDASQIDLVVFATICGDNHSPSMSCALAQHLGVKCPAIDINCACTGFIYALDIAEGYFLKKRVKKALVVCAEHMSRYMDWSDRASCVLFGDGAGAAVLAQGDDLLSIKTSSHGMGELIKIPFMGDGSPFNTKAYPKPYLQMNGAEVYKFAVSNVPLDIREALQSAKLTLSDVSYILLHQANYRIIDAVREKMNMPKEKFLTNIHKCGNTSAASIPILLDEENKKGTFKKGDIIVLAGFGGGMTTGACVLKWQ